MELGEVGTKGVGGRGNESGRSGEVSERGGGRGANGVGFGGRGENGGKVRWRKMCRWRMMWCKRSRGGRSDETVGKGVGGKRGEGGGFCGGR